MRKQVASVQAQVQDFVVICFVVADQATESSADKIVIFMIQTVVSIAILRSSRRTSFYSAVEKALRSSVAEAPEPWLSYNKDDQCLCLSCSGEQI